MTKKHFIALADAIRQRNTILQEYPEALFTADHLDMLANFCAAQNPNFNRERWLGYIAGTNGKNGGKL